MAVTYKKLWKMLIDKDLKKERFGRASKGQSLRSKQAL